MPIKKKANAPRKPAAKRVAKKNAVSVIKSVVESSDKSPQALKAYPLEEVIRWRDSARKRIVSRQERLKKLSAQHERIIREADKLDKGLHSDLCWCKKLNKTIASKVF